MRLIRSTALRLVQEDEEVIKVNFLCLSYVHCTEMMSVKDFFVNCCENRNKLMLILGMAIRPKKWIPDFIFLTESGFLFD